MLNLVTAACFLQIWRLRNYLGCDGVDSKEGIPFASKGVGEIADPFMG